jgi:hypothetical protein
MSAVSHRLTVVVAAIALAVAACGGSTSARPDRATAAPSVATATTAPPTPASDRKVLLIVEENHGYGQIIGDPHAPYLNEVARAYGTATHVDAGYPARCPSLAAYLLLTSGSTDGVCDDKAPGAHPLTGDNVFHQVVKAGRQWRGYAESSPGLCALANSGDGRYLVRHVPATYYLNIRTDCRRWSEPLGQAHTGALHDDIAAGDLPAFGFITPDACDDMHGAPACPVDGVTAGDRWLRTWIPQILAGPDYRSGRLTIIITWDEGTGSDNHIPTLIVSPTTRHITAADPYTHCSTLRTIETLLRLPLLGCAGPATSMTAAFAL